MKQTVLFLLAMILCCPSLTKAQRMQPTLFYHVSMEQPQKHYFTVTLTVTGSKNPFIDFVMPVWTPGSYLVREFSRNLQEFEATDGAGQALTFEKITKNSWRVTTRSGSPVTVQYRVYAYEISVRTSFLDDMHGYINGASVFLYPDGLQNLPLTLSVEPPSGWRTVSTSLDPAGASDSLFTFTAPNYDTLVDCPIEIGSHQEYPFSVRNVPHTVAVYGVGNYDSARLIPDMKRIVETGTSIFGDIPYRRYTFLTQLLQNGSGGLEHASSVSLQYRRWGFKPESAYKRWLSLVAHEYFHLWNVKRIRPKALGPFDYTHENYTRLLWVAEGFTTYYSAIILRRAELTTPQELIGWVSSQITDIQSKPGRLVQSVEEASFDAWIKYYRPNENSDNTTISYYNKGAVMGLLMDLEIRHRTGGRKSLDEVLKTLYGTFAREKGRGFTDVEFRQTCESVAGGSLAELFDRYVSGVQEFDYNRYLGYAGLRLISKPADGGSYLGIKTRKDNGRMMVSHVISDSPAEAYGLNVNDELIAMDGLRIDDDYADRLAERQPAALVTITVARDGILREIDVILGTSPLLSYRIEPADQPTGEQRLVYEGWTHSNWPTP